MWFCSGKQPPSTEPEEDIDPRLKSCDPELIAKIEMEIVDNGDPITFDDIGKVHETLCCCVVIQMLTLTSFPSLLCTCSWSSVREEMRE